SVSSTIAMLPQWQVPSSFALMAADYQPQLATLVKAPPEGDGWLHEVKYDGYRIGCRIQRRAVTLWSRRGNDWTRDFPEIVAAAKALKGRSAQIDGEIAVLLPDGRTSFQALQKSLAGERQGELVYFVFDLFENDRLRFAGKVGTGFTQASSRALRKRLDSLRTSACPFEPPPPGWLGRNARWVQSRLLAEVTFTEWTEGGHVRHPSFQGLREDKPARQVKRERTEVRGIGLSHAARIVYPAQRYTKLDLARYHDAVAEHELPHLRGRPLTLVRCPKEIGDGCYFMKHSKVW